MGKEPVLILYLLLFAWPLLNSRKVSSIRPFDPDPFSLLAVTVAIEAVLPDFIRTPGVQSFSQPTHLD